MIASRAVSQLPVAAQLPTMPADVQPNTLDPAHAQRAATVSPSPADQMQSLTRNLANISTANGGSNGLQLPAVDLPLVLLITTGQRVILSSSEDWSQFNFYGRHQHMSHAMQTHQIIPASKPGYEFV